MLLDSGRDSALFFYRAGTNGYGDSSPKAEMSFPEHLIEVQAVDLRSTWLRIFISSPRILTEMASQGKAGCQRSFVGE